MFVTAVRGASSVGGDSAVMDDAASLSCRLRICSVSLSARNVARLLSPDEAAMSLAVWPWAFVTASCFRSIPKIISIICLFPDSAARCSGVAAASAQRAERFSFVANFARFKAVKKASAFTGSFTVYMATTCRMFTPATPSPG